jgi:hypothetical protein
MVISQRAAELLRELPSIRRARGYYLYDASGNRILDLFQDGGRAWLGHRPDGLSLQIKNSLSRGVYAPYPSPEEGKLLKALKALGEAIGATEAEGWLALYLRPSHTRKAMLWRPGTPWPSEEGSVEVLLPLPGLEYGQILFERSGAAGQLRGDLPSPVLAAALNRTVWNLIHAIESPEKESPLPDCTGDSWHQDGAYLRWKGGEEAYGDCFRKALSRGILISPDPGLPTILPLNRSDADNTLIRKFFQGE